MTPGGVPFRIGPLLNSLPIHPSSVNGRYQLCVLFPYPTLLASQARYGKRYEGWPLSRNSHRYENAAQLHSPRINGRLSRAWTEYGARPLSSPYLSPKDFFWKVKERMVRQDV